MRLLPLVTLFSLFGISNQAFSMQGPNFPDSNSGQTKSAVAGDAKVGNTDDTEGKIEESSLKPYRVIRVLEGPGSNVIFSEKKSDSTKDPIDSKGADEEFIFVGLSSEQIITAFENDRIKQATSLDLSPIVVDPSKFIHVIANNSFPNLRTVNLNLLNLQDKHVGDLCALIQNAPKLTELSLAFNKLSNEGYFLLRPAAQARKLRRLSLEFNPGVSLLNVAFGLNGYEYEYRHPPTILMQDGIVWAFGANSFGQLGD